MKILVTGAGGFAGGHIGNYLHTAGHDVAGTWRNHKPEADYKLIRTDLASEIRIDFKPDVIVHAAGALPYRTASYAEYVGDNIDSMRNLLDFANSCRTKRFINLSTIGIYGEFRDEVINEDSDRINLDGYGVTKYAAECLLREQICVEGISLRMPGIIGPGARGVWLTNTIEKMRRNEDVTIYTPDFVTKNFVWVGDLAQFVAHLVSTEKWKYDTLVLACKKGATVRNIVDAIKRRTESFSRITVNDAVRKPFCLDASRAFEMGYEPMSAMEIVNNT